LAFRMIWLFALAVFNCAPLTSSGNLKTIADSYQRGEVERARCSLQSYLTTHPTDPEALYWAAVLEPQAPTAARHLQELLSQESKGELSDRATIGLGVNLYSQGLYLSGQKALRHSFSDTALKAKGRYWLGRTFLALNQPDSARSCFQSVLSSGTTPLLRGLAQIGAGDSYLVKGEYALALREYRRAEESFPLPQLLPQILWKEALSLQGLHRDKEAHRYYGYILDRFPGSYMAEDAGRRLGQRPAKKRFSIQLGAFKKGKNAKNLQRLLAGDGYQAWIEVKGELFTVLVGSLGGREETQALGKDLQARYKLGYRIVPLN